MIPPPATPQKERGDYIEINEITGEAAKTLKQNWIAYIRKEESRKIPYCDVFFIEQTGNMLLVKRDTDDIKIPGRIRDISKILHEPFFQCHSSLMINFDRVSSMTKGQIIFDNMDKKYLGRDSFAQARKNFNKYLLGQ